MGRPFTCSRLKRRNRKKEQEEQAKLATQKDGIGGSIEGLLQNPRRPVEANLAQTFAEIVNSIRTELQAKEDRPAHNAAVDIRLTFNSVEVKAKNLIVKRDQKESSVSLELATRILPE